jgi:AAA+ ATPase superfamily predicted ATPase
MVGRKQEVNKLKSALLADKSSFIAVTGRRRVGKTFLIDTILMEHYCFSLTGIQNGNKAAQLFNFSVKLSEYMQSEIPIQFDAWQKAFHQLRNYLKTLSKKKKQVIFIDELPWVSTAKSGFIQLLAHLWNDYLSKEKHFVLVICGSATSWISQKIINDKGGLHNRVSEIIHLKPFTLHETKQFLESQKLRFTDHQIAKIYMTLGGIPFYLEQIKKGESFSAAIERMCFSTSGILKNEYSNLYESLFSNAAVHLSIVQVLAKAPAGLSYIEIMQKLKRPSSGSYTRAIEELLISDFLLQVSSFNKKKRGITYRLTDEYSIFYHRFIKDNQKYVPGIWMQLSGTQAYKSWSGYAFENFCYKHIKGIKKALGIEAVFTSISSLRVFKSEEQEDFQIDFIIDRMDDTINLCEIKFYDSIYTITKSVYNQLRYRKTLFQEYTSTKKQVFTTMITSHGIKENAYASDVVDFRLRLEDLFRE